ncbi:MAG: tRNA (adenosine(37)-N6)-threonylcarbamoyltransferase complex dimerization subunit type 1 TsaB [Chthoniobacterales bacterium]
MQILAIENSTSTGSIVLSRDGAVVFEESFSAPRGKGSPLFEALQRCLKEKENRIDRIAVGTGPGSYNGIRIALAAGKGVQLVEKADFVAVSSSLCLPVEVSPYIWFGDARAGQFHFSEVANRTFQDGPRLVTREELQVLLTDLGFPAFSDITHEGLLGYEVAIPSARILGELAPPAPVETTMPEPLYLKPPHITLPRNTPTSQSCIPSRSG